MFKIRPRQHPLFVEEELSFRRRPRHLRLRFVLALMITLSAAGWAWERVSASEVPLDDIEAGQLLLVSQPDGRQTTALNLDSKVHFQVSGMVNHVTLQQQFRNDSQDWVEGVYVFPLPDKAAVHRMRIMIGERVIEGKVKEKAEAQKIYREAKVQGKKAGLVKQQRPNMFTTKVANIGPYETVMVELEYVETVAFDTGTFSLRFPMTITPRYIPGKPLFGQENAEESSSAGQGLTSSALGWAVNTDQVPDASEITPWLNPVLPGENQLINPIEITAELDMGIPLQVIDSAYHNIISSRDKNHYTLRLTRGRVSMTQDFVLSWAPQPGDTPRAAVFSEAVAGEQYGLLMMVPPSGQVRALPREAIYVIDTSGSMDGVSIRQARQSLLYALEQLSPEDRFNVIAFNSHTTQLFSAAVPATPQNITAAKRFVSSLHSGGGTEMLTALQAALRDPASESHVRQVMFITDGAVGNEQALFQTIHQQLGGSRLFTVGIGSAPNSHFMRKAAQFGRGTFTHIGKVGEVEEKMRALIAKLDRPVMTNMQIEWPDHRVVEHYPERVPDLYSGEPLLVAAKLDDISGDIIVTGQRTGKDWQQRIHVEGVQNHKGVATLWAREKIASLLGRKTAGADPEEIRQKVLDVALTHQLVSPYTSFVAVEDVVSRPSYQSLKTNAVSNARPKGQGPQPFAFPQTATGAPAGLLWGAALLLMGLVLRVTLEREERYALVD